MNCPNDRYVNDARICQTVAANLCAHRRQDQPGGRDQGHLLPQDPAPRHQLLLLGWTPGTYDAHNALNALMACVDDKGAGQFNLGSYCNPKVDQLTKAIQSETDKTKRNAMIKEAFKLHADDIGHIPLHQQALAWGVSKKVDAGPAARQLHVLQVDVDQGCEGKSLMQ